MGTELFSSSDGLGVAVAQAHEATAKFSIFDRPPTDADSLPEGQFYGAPIARDTVRLALEAPGIRVFVARAAPGGPAGGICVGVVRDEIGSGMSCGLESSIAERGFFIMTMGSGQGRAIVGLTPDDVTAVMIGGVPATLGTNAFLALGSASDVTVTRAGQVATAEIPPLGSAGDAPPYKVGGGVAIEVQPKEGPPDR